MKPMKERNHMQDTRDIQAPELLTVSQVCKILGFTPATIITMIRNGTLEGFQMSAGRRNEWRIYADSLRKRMQPVARRED